MKYVPKQVQKFVLISFSCALVFSCIVVSYTKSYGDYAGEMEDRLKREASEDKYWENQEKIYNRLEIEEKESALEYRKERRNLDIQERKDKSRSRTINDNKNHRKRIK